VRTDSHPKDGQLSWRRRNWRLEHEATEQCAMIALGLDQDPLDVADLSVCSRRGLAH
jgi:hypothetical protein